MDTSDSGLDEPGDEQQTKRLELGTLPETIGEADLEKLNLALRFLFGRLREARAQFEQKGDNGRLEPAMLSAHSGNSSRFSERPMRNPCKCQSCACKMRSQALSRIEWSRSFSRSSARDAPPQVMLMVA